MSIIPKYTPLKFVDETINNMVELGVQEGVFCTNVEEPIPTFIEAKCEKVITQFGNTGHPNNNSYIVLGRDRPSNLASGAGGAGMTSCGMIDLVVGRYALNSADEMKKPSGKPIGKEERVNPNFITDAARIYITQKALNIDEYFGISNTKTQSYVLENKSAVALKADNIRMIGRETIRIFCGPTQNCEGLPPSGETNSLGGKLSKPRIDIVAGNESTLQPAVLGDNLITYLDQVEDHIQRLNSSIQTISEHLMAINAMMSVLTFGAPPFSTNFVGDMTMWTEQLFGSINSELRKLSSLNSLEFIKGQNSIVSNSVFIS